MPALSLGRVRIPARVVVWIGALGLALSIGADFGIGNHNTYLLHAVRLANPEVLANDWLAAGTTDYQPVFTLLAALLLWVDSSGWFMALANLVVTAACAVAVYRIVRAIVGRDEVLPVYIVALALVGLGATYAVSGSYIVSEVLQPSSVSGAAFLFAIALYLERRWLGSGLALAIAGLFHANYLVLAFPLFIGVHLLLSRSGLAGRLIRQVGPSLVPVIIWLPLLVRTSMAPEAAAARYIFQQIQAPQHYVPMTFLSEFVPLAAWLALGVTGARRAVSRLTWRSTTGALWLTMTVMIAVATLLTTVVFVPAVSAVYVWRLAPYVLLLAQIMAVAGAVSLVSRSANMAWWRLAVVVAVLALLVHVIIDFHFAPHRVAHMRLMVAAVGMIFLFGLPGVHSISTGTRRVVVAVLAVVVWGYAAWVAIPEAAAQSRILNGFPAAQAEMHQWARTKTPREAVFLIDPNMLDFRLNARRAVIVDGKSTPVLPAELLEWYHRLETVSGTEGVSGRVEASRGYASIDAVRAERIRGEYPFSYMVLFRDKVDGVWPGYATVFENDGYVVLEPKGDVTESE